MTIVPLTAFRSFIGAKSFFLFLFFLSSVLSAAEVTRSLSMEDKVRILEQQLAAANRMRAESQFEITNLKNEIRELRGIVEEQGYQLQQIVNRQRELYRDIDNRLAEQSNNEVATGQKPPVADTSLSSQQTTTASNLGVKPTTAPLTTPTEPVVVDNNQIRSEYDQIFPLVRTKRYDDAIAGYQQFIANYPDSIYVANSKYWLAQIYSVQRRTDEAEREYLSVAQQYPDSSKASDAWLKLGQLYESQNQSEKALNAYNQVVTQYSNSTAAQIAINRLQALKAGN
ncbi:MAG: tol-pal system protein YbgF [Gammaproteobacteria bacterium]|nr:tol-pal system protein YbgF [Gammaproteobacteria bacterium]